MTAISAGAALPHADDEDLFGHPKGLYVCFFTEMWERFSFYGMKALLLLYVTKHHLFSDDDGLALLGAYGGMVYASPMLGGMIADRYLGARKSVFVGGILLALGHLGMAVEGHQATILNGVVHRDLFALSVFYFSLSLITIGVGMLKPNVATVVGKLYAENDPRRDAGFTIYYAGINLGSIFSSLVCGYIGVAFSWGWGFGAAGIGMIFGLLVFVTGQRYLQGHAEPPDPARLKRRTPWVLNLEWTLYGGALLAVFATWGLLQLGHAVFWLQAALLAIWFVWLLWYAFKRCDKVQRERMLAILYYIFMVLVFFSLYEQTYGGWVIFTDRMLNPDLFPSLVIRSGNPWPWSVIPLVLSPFVVASVLRLQSAALAKLIMALLTVFGFALIFRDCAVLPQNGGSLTYLGGVWLVLLTPIFAWLWPWLERRGLNPDKPLKMAIGMALTGLSFLPLAWGNNTVTPDHLGSVWWLVLAYLVLEVGEVCLSPITLAAVSELTVPAVASIMMGSWLLAISFSEQFASLFGSLASLDIPADGKIDFAVAVSKYGALFYNMCWLGLGTAALALILRPLILRWMHGIR